MKNKDLKIVKVVEVNICQGERLLPSIVITFQYENTGISQNAYISASVDNFIKVFKIFGVDNVKDIRNEICYVKSSYVLVDEIIGINFESDEEVKIILNEQKEDE